MTPEQQAQREALVRAVEARERFLNNQSVRVAAARTEFKRALADQERALLASGAARNTLATFDQEHQG